MDRREFLGDPQEALRAAMDGRQATMWTALPGIIQKYDADKQTVDVQPAIKGAVLKPNNVVESVTMPLCLDCPVQFPSGGGVTLTFPVKEGDECLLVFASRCIDAWWQQGDVQTQAEFRMHDLSDGFAVIGFRSVPNALSPAADPDKVQLRSDDASTLIELDPDGQVITLTAPGGVTINADVTVNGTIDATGEVTGNGTALHTHHHSGVTTGGGNTGPPT